MKKCVLPIDFNPSVFYCNEPTGDSLDLPDKEFVGKDIAIKDSELDPRVWKYFIFSPTSASSSCFQNLA